MKISVVIELEFKTREELDQYIEHIQTREAGYIAVLDQVIAGLESKRSTLDSQDDLDLIPKIIELVNFHIPYCVNKDPDFMKKAHITGLVATKVFFDNERQVWTTDNGFQMYSTLESSMKWFYLSMKYD